MSLTPNERSKALAWVQRLPAKRGVDIPTHHYDAIHQIASGITQPMWGRPPSPQQMQWLWEQRAVTPDAIHAAYGELAHPHAPNIQVKDWSAYVQAHKVYQEHGQ